MDNSKITKGKWILDPKSESIKNENVTGLLATTWSVYNADKTEIRNPGESWLDMRERTKIIREQKKIETRANAELIAEAGNIRQQIPFSLTELKRQRDEMLEMLKKCEKYFLLQTSLESEERANAIGQLIKESTELN